MLPLQAERGSAREAARARFAVLDGGQDATEAAQPRRDVAAMSQSALAYARLHVAARLLQRGIERHRQRQQGPLLARAGRHFATLTDGRYDELRVAFDEKDEPLLHVHHTGGAELPVEALSEGTRDQLYLALRVAAIENHAGTAEPLPFIGDDLLVQFDDERSAAALRLLAALGESTQVVLFTHHHHLAEMAQACLPPAALSMHDLAA